MLLNVARWHHQSLLPKKNLHCSSTMIIRTLSHTNYTNMLKHQQKSPSPTNANAFTLDGWMTRTRPIACTVSGRTGDIIGFNNCYFEAE
jgi:hypothetical protein